MSKSIKKLSLKQGDDIEDFYFDSTTGIKGYDLYDTEEVIVGKWTNGKPIYRKVFTGLSITWKKDAWINLVATAANNIESATNVMFRANDCWIVPEEWKTSNGYVTAETGYVGGTRVINEAIIEYTKTTDDPDSFEEENVELTSEHKTGETFNGKPVYETWRTFLVPNSNSAVKVGSVTDLNIDTMLEIYGMMNDKTHFIPFPDILASSGSFFGIMVRDFGTSGEYNVYVSCAQATATFKNQPIHVKFKYTKK